MTRISLSLLAITASASTALAHTGHMANHGAGHSHWLGYGLLALAVAIPAGVVVFRRLRKRARA